MKRLRIQKWGIQCLTPRIRPSSQFSCQSRPCPQQLTLAKPIRFRSQSSLAAEIPIEPVVSSEQDAPPSEEPQITQKHHPWLQSPPISEARKSAKLAALHARLSLPARFPIESLARTLVHPTADPSTNFNNTQFGMLGSDLLSYYTSEHLMCHYPRLPINVLFAAQWGYMGPSTLSIMATEWGVETAYPGPEVDPGFLQFVPPRLDPDAQSKQKALESITESAKGWKRGMNWRIMSDNPFGEQAQTLSAKDEAKYKAALQDANKGQEDLPSVSIVDARASFVRALVGALYMHSGRIATQRFFAAHFLSRQLDLAKLFDFKVPTHDLSRLCAREGFEPPIARIISETGRLSRHPVFVVGVYSGGDELGQAAGASLDEARTRAAAAALKSWYLYSPLQVTKPSSVEGSDKGAKWIPNLVDPGEVVT